MLSLPRDSAYQSDRNDRAVPPQSVSAALSIEDDDNACVEAPEIDEIEESVSVVHRRPARRTAFKSRKMMGNTIFVLEFLRSLAERREGAARVRRRGALLGVGRGPHQRRERDGQRDPPPCF